MSFPDQHRRPSLGRAASQPLPPVRSSSKRSTILRATFMDASDSSTCSTPQTPPQIIIDNSLFSTTASVIDPYGGSLSSTFQAQRAHNYRQVVQQSNTACSLLDPEYSERCRPAANTGQRRHSNTSKISKQASQHAHQRYRRRSPSASSVSSLSSRQSSPAPSGVQNLKRVVAPNTSAVQTGFIAPTLRHGAPTVIPGLDGAQLYSNSGTKSTAVCHPGLSTADGSGHFPFLSSSIAPSTTLPVSALHCPTPSLALLSLNKSETPSGSFGLSASQQVFPTPNAISSSTVTNLADEGYMNKSTDYPPLQPSRVAPHDTPTYEIAPNNRKGSIFSGVNVETSSVAATTDNANMVTPNYTNSFIHASQGGTGSLIDTSRLRGRVMRPWN